MHRDFPYHQAADKVDKRANRQAEEKEPENVSGQAQGHAGLGIFPRLPVEISIFQSENNALERDERAQHDAGNHCLAGVAGGELGS